MPGKQPYAGIWIRDFLLKKGSSYPQEIHREFKKWCTDKGYHKQSYDSTRRYINELKRLGLIKLIGTRKSNNPILKDRHYYTVIDKDNPLWLRPFKRKKSF